MQPYNYTGPIVINEHFSLIERAPTSSSNSLQLGKHTVSLLCTYQAPTTPSLDLWVESHEQCTVQGQIVTPPTSSVHSRGVLNPIPSIDAEVCKQTFMGSCPLATNRMGARYSPKDAIQLTKPSHNQWYNSRYPYATHPLAVGGS